MDHILLLVKELLVGFLQIQFLGLKHLQACPESVVLALHLLADLVQLLALVLPEVVLDIGAL